VKPWSSIFPENVMAQPAVVVVFSSRCGATETIAHAAAIGTVNARALPRLRWLTHDGVVVPPECAVTWRRLQKEYVPPTEPDIVGSQALIIVPSAGMTPSSDQWQPFVALLDRMAQARTLAGKVGAVIDPGDSHTVDSFSSALSVWGFAVIAADGRDARAHGRAVGAAIVGTHVPPR
jgi:flavodoxin